MIAQNYTILYRVLHKFAFSFVPLLDLLVVLLPIPQYHLISYYIIYIILYHIFVYVCKHIYIYIYLYTFIYTHTHTPLDLSLSLFRAFAPPGICLTTKRLCSDYWTIINLWVRFRPGSNGIVDFHTIWAISTMRLGPFWLLFLCPNSYMWKASYHCHTHFITFPGIVWTSADAEITQLWIWTGAPKCREGQSQRYGELCRPCPWFMWFSWFSGVGSIR